MLVWIASYPRSGNTFLRIALHRLYGRKSLPERSQRVIATKGDPQHLREHWMHTDLSEQEMAAADEKYFAKTHDLPGADENPAIYVLRDGRDALVSYAWFSLMLHDERPPETINGEAFRTALCNIMLDRRAPYGVWGQHALAWIKRPRTAVVRFEDLIRDPAQCLAGALDQLRLTLPRVVGATVPSFDELHALKPQFYRRGAVGAWRDEFPADLLEVFWREHGEGMLAAGYRCEPEPSPRLLTTA